MGSRTAAAALLVTAMATATLAGCSGSDDGGDAGAPQTITVWSLENQPDRINTTKAIAAAFTKETGVKVDLVAIDEAQFPQLVASSALSGKLPDVMGAISLSSTRQLNDQKIANKDAAKAIVDKLGEKTFASSALDLTRDNGDQLAVPDSAYAQILVYRKDLFQQAGLEPPTTYDTLRTAAQKLTTGGRYGITLATDPADVFTSQTFESLALGNNCQLVGENREIKLNSSECGQTWGLYGDLAQKYSPKGTQTVDTTRASYFAGQAAMVDWSTYILDELAGLRKDALPTCPQCKADPAWLAKNSGIVTDIRGPSGGAGGGTYGEITSWVVSAKTGKKVDAAEKFVEYMMSTGYLQWLGMAPEGKVPVRTGDANDPNKFSTGWKALKAGVDTKKPLSDIYDAATITALENAPKSINRWAIPQGQGALLGPVNTQLVVPKVIGELGNGAIDAQKAATQATDQVSQLQAKLK
ncbi:ABC transporter substrate-binding protein [Kribbella sp. NPDC048928]|uniref:ABC transporter substrate-binding protein n=1 Tax=Kribbella sp. NPDC048928 TaxID=3364111 RepID=UPI00371A3A68